MRLLSKRCGLTGIADSKEAVAAAATDLGSQIAAGMKSDTVDIELNDGPPNFLAIPRKGAIISVKMGFGDDLVPKGVFTADKVNVDCLPYKMSISGKAADLRSGKLKERQERSWDKSKLGDILSQIASESGLTPAVDDDLDDCSSNLSLHKQSSVER